MFSKYYPRSLALGALLLLGPLACDDAPTEPSTLRAGTYTATTFRVIPTGQPPLEVLAGGGTLTITVAADGRTSGRLFVPASLTGDDPLDASMAGTAVQAGGEVRFEQTADTFVRDLEWQVGTSTLTVVDQPAGSARFTITLTRQP
jgi:hypothetical protein